MSGNGDNSGVSYMPERYRQQIEARKRRRTVVRLATLVVVIAVCAAVLVLISGAGHVPSPVATGMHSPGPIPLNTTSTVSVTSPAIPVTNESSISPIATSSSPDPVLSPALLAAQQETGILPYDQAQAYIRYDYPVSSYVLVSADITGPPDKRLYAFVIRPVTGPASGLSTTVYIDAVTGDPYSLGQENAGVTPGKAENTIADLFPGLHPDMVRVRYWEIPGGESFWNFSLFIDNSSILSGALDGDTGQIITFSRTITVAGRPVQPVLSAAAARALSDQYISDRNGPVAMNLSGEQYAPLGTVQSPVAGRYILDYDRLVQDYPCDYDGFTVSVDSVSGEITGYERRWDDPEYAFVVSPVPTVLARDATFTVLHQAQDTFPGLATGITIISADIRWKDGHPAGTTPRPGSIPLAWKIVFDDELIRSEQSPVPAVAWVDAQTGALLEFDYQP